MKEKIHPPKVEIGPSSFFDDGPADPQLVTVASGPYCEKLPIAGRTVAELREQFSARFDIDPASTAVIGGKDAGESVVLQAGVTIMFMNRAGEKGARHSHTQEERMKTIAAKMVPFADWVIEYEIPPLRAIYYHELTNYSVTELLRFIQGQKPPWYVREIVRKQP